MIKVVHLITDLDIGGSETMLLRLLRAIDRTKFDNIVICMLGKGELIDSIKDIGIPVYTLNMSRIRDGIPGLFRLCALLMRERPEILQTWLYHANLLGTIAARLCGIRITIWNLRSSILHSKICSGRTLFIMRILAFFSFLPNAILINSKAGKETHKKLGYNMNRTKVIYNGFDLDKFSPNPDARAKIRKELNIDDDKIVIGLVARFDPIKDHATFIKAANILLVDHADVHFVLAGKMVTCHNTILQDEIRSSGRPKNFHLLGERNDIANIMSSLDMFTLSSISEGFSSVVAEAMSCGIPCIVTDCGDSSFLVGESGIVFPVQDAEALAQAWNKIISMKKEERNKLGIIARKRIESCFSISAIAHEYQRLYLDLTKNHKF